METNSNRRIVEQMFEAFAAAHRLNPEDILCNMSDDGEWWVAGSLPSSGTFTKKQMIENFRQIRQITDDGLKIVPRAWIVDGERMAIEAESHMKLRNGRVYNNHYHFSIEMRDGKILRVKEYMDTHHSYTVFML